MLSRFAAPAPAPAAPAPAAPAPAAPPDDQPLDILSEVSGKSAPAAADSGSGVMDFDGIADYLESEMQGFANRQQQPAGTAPDAPATPAPAGGPTVAVSGKTDPLAGEGIAISVEIFVEILEAVSSSLGAWWARDESAEFSFEKKMKESYAKILTIYANHQQIEVSPGFLVGAYTVLLLGKVGLKAHKRRQEVLRAESFRKSVIEKNSKPKANSAGQLRMDFGGTEKPPAAEIKIDSQGKGFSVPDADRRRADWKIDQGGYYVTDSQGKYLKKGERSQRPSPELRAFIDDYYAANIAHPSNKVVKTFLQSL